MALSVCTKMDSVFRVTSTVRDSEKSFPPVPLTARVYDNSGNTAGICSHTAGTCNFVTSIITHHTPTTCIKFRHQQNLMNKKENTVDKYEQLQQCAETIKRTILRSNKLTFDLLTLKVVSESRVTGATSMPILVFLGLSVLETRVTPDVRDGQTDRQTTDKCIA